MNSNNYVARWPRIYNGALLWQELWISAQKWLLNWDRFVYMYTICFALFQTNQALFIFIIFSRNRLNISFHFLFIIIVVVFVVVAIGAAVFFISQKLYILIYSFIRTYSGRIRAMAF